MSRVGTWVAAAATLLAMAGCESSDATSYAKMVETPDELIGGPGALGMVGDYILSNNKIRVIIQDKGWSRGFGVFGGGVIDADIVRPRDVDGREPAGRDNFGEGFPVFFLKAFDVEDQRIRDENGEVVEVKGIEVINDGSNGEAAVVRTYAKGGDFLTMMGDMLDNAVDTSNIHFETDYILEPGARHIIIRGRLANDTSRTVAVAKPLLAGVLGVESLDVPVGDILLFGAGNNVFAPGGVTRLERDNDPKKAGFDLRYSVEASFAVQAENGVSLPALPGLVTDFLATRGDGVSYGYAAGDDERNYTWLNRDQYSLDPLADVTQHSLLVPFLFSSFTGALTSVPPAELGPNERWEYTRYLIVGDGDIQSIRRELFSIRGKTTGIFGGEVVDTGTGQPVSGARVMLFDSRGLPYSEVDTDSSGRFAADVEPGTYSWLVASHGRFPYPAEADRSVEFNGFTMTGSDGDQVEDVFRLIRVPGTAGVGVRVRDNTGRPLPAKVTLVSTFELPERCLNCERDGQDCLLECAPRNYLFDFTLGEHRRSTDLSWNEGENGEFIEGIFYTDVKGVTEGEIRPGTYDVYASRGNEYDRVIKTGVQFNEGERTFLNFELVRTVETTDYIGTDLHVHSGNSLDSSISQELRVTTAAAEGLEVAVATDHNYVTDFEPTIAALGLQDWVKSIIGAEVSTLEMGHFNGFPLEHYPGAASHFPYVDPCFEGRAYKSNETAFDWVECTPQKLFDSIRDLGSYCSAEGDCRENTVVQVNHPRDSVLGYFSQYFMHPYTAVAEENPSADNYSLVGFPIQVSPHNDLTGQFESQNFSYDFDAVEVFNGKRHDQVHSFKLPEGQPDAFYAELQAFECPEDSGHPLNGPGKPLLRHGGHKAYPGAIEDWMNLISQAYICVPPEGDSTFCARQGIADGLLNPITATGNSDSHDAHAEVGFPKNYVYVEPVDGESRDLPPNGVHELELVDAIKAHKVIVTNGPFIQMRVRTAVSGGESAEYRDWFVGEMVRYGGSNVNREVRVLIEMRKANWIGVDELVLWANGQVLERIDVSSAGATWLRELTYTFEKDTFLVLEALSSQSMFPLLPPKEDPPANISDALDGLVGGLGLDTDEFGSGDGLKSPTPLQLAVPYAVTNPIWLDIDADSIFTPPGTSGGPGAAPDEDPVAVCEGDTKARRGEKKFNRRILQKRASKRYYERADIRRIFDGLHDH